MTLIDAEGNVAGSMLTGDDGRYEFTGLTPGAYTLAASGYAPVAVPVELSGHGNDQDLVLGTATAPETLPVPSVPISAWDRG